jgi:trimethylamine--corrinoid protein Co-methyltransferase
MSFKATFCRLENKVRQSTMKSQPAQAKHKPACRAADHRPSRSRLPCPAGRETRQTDREDRARAAADVCDGQAAHKSRMAIRGAMMGGTDPRYHDGGWNGGWLEGGLTASFEKMVMDPEMLRMTMAFTQPVPVDDSLGLEATCDVAPGGHFFGTAHTMARYETAFYTPMLADRRNDESRLEAGAQNTTQRASAVWQQLLAEYEVPAMDAAVREQLDSFVAKRKEELSRSAA